MFSFSETYYWNFSRCPKRSILTELVVNSHWASFKLRVQVTIISKNRLWKIKNYDIQIISHNSIQNCPGHNFLVILFDSRRTPPLFNKEQRNWKAVRRRAPPSSWYWFSLLPRNRQIILTGPNADGIFRNWAEFHVCFIRFTVLKFKIDS